MRPGYAALSCWLFTSLLVFNQPLLHAEEPQSTPERQSTLAQQQALAVTIYNQDLALVKDTRAVQLQAGFNALAFKDVSAQIRSETAVLRSLTHSQGFALIEQNFDFDLLTPQKLLEKYVGQTVTVIKRHPTTGEETEEAATVLATNNGVVLRIGDRIETGIPGRIAFAKVPDNLRERPTLVMQLTSGTAREQSLELSYLTGGLSWRADYVAELNKQDTALDLTGWVTLTNQSGTRYNNATLQLVAGDVHRVHETFALGAADAMSAPRAAPERKQMKEESLFEYHLYTLGHKTTLANNQTKQVALLSAQSIPVRKQLLLMGNQYYYLNSMGRIGQPMKIGVYIHFNNDKDSHLGKPLPKGIVRVYKKDQASNAQFVGEDRIDHTPELEEVALKLGEAFDVTAKKRQTNFKKQSGVSPYNYIYTATFEVVLKNAKDKQQTVKVREPIPGDWEILKASHPHKKTAAHTAEWDITVPAKGKETLTYQVKVKL
jgi:hypothetical protein